MLAELKLTGVHKPGAYAPLPPLPPIAPLALFVTPDLSGTSNAKEAKKLLADAMAMYDLSRKVHEDEVAATTARYVKSCDQHAKELNISKSCDQFRA